MEEEARCDAAADQVEVSSTALQVQLVSDEELHTTQLGQIKRELLEKQDHVIKMYKDTFHVYEVS